MCHVAEKSFWLLERSKLFFLDLLDRKVSNVAVNAVVQAEVQMKESDSKKYSFVLEV